MIKFLVVRFSSIGDIVLTTPVIRCLKKQVDGAEVYYLTKAQYAPVLESNPYITKIYRLEDNFGKLLKELRQENFDYIIDLHNNLRTKRLKFALKRMAFSFDKLNIRKWILVNFKKDYLPDIHIVDRYLETLGVFSVENDDAGLDFFLPEIEEQHVSRLLKIENEPFIAIIVGGGHQTKQIPASRIVAIMDALDNRIVLLGGKEDIEKSETICRTSENKNVYSLTGEINIQQSAAVIKRASLVITPDTGMMHIAAALGKTIFSVWGNTIPKFGMYPYKAGDHSFSFEVEGLSCRPCSKIGYPSCPRKHFRCMEEQDYDSLIQRAKKLLTRVD